MLLTTAVQWCDEVNVERYMNMRCREKKTVAISPDKSVYPFENKTPT